MLDSRPRGIAGYPPVILGFDLENWSRGLNDRYAFAWGVCGVCDGSARGLLACLLDFGGVLGWRRRKKQKKRSPLSTPKRRAFASSKRPSSRSNTPTRASAHRSCAKPGH
nr:MAG TPA: hypothetical protein [Caudoviricetes sp.]